MSKCKLMSFTEIQKNMTSKVQKLMPRYYEYLKIKLWIKNINNGFYPVKWNAPTGKGTSVKFASLHDDNTYEMEIAKLDMHCKEVNDRLRTNYKVKFRKGV